MLKKIHFNPFFARIIIFENLFETNTYIFQWTFILQLFFHVEKSEYEP